MKMCKSGVLALVAVCLLSAAAFGIEPVVPPWRGEYSTTSQLWDFGYVPQAPAQPPYEYLPDGPAPGGQPPLSSTVALVTPGPGMTWIDIDPDSGREGIWPLSGRIELTVDNHEPPNEFKWVYVGIVWRPQDAGEVPILDGFDPDPDPGHMPRIVEETDLGLGWMATTYEWRIYPNPVWEKFTISGTIDVDQLVVDTWCIPEPGTIVLLAIGALGLIRKRRG